METCRRPYGRKGNGVHRGCGRKNSSRQGNVEKNKFSTLHTKFSTFKCGKNFLKKERRLEVSLCIYSNILNNQKMIQGLQLAVLQEILLFKRWGNCLLFFPAMERNKDRRGPAPRSASAPVANPGPHYGGRIPGGRTATPARAVIGLPSVLRRCRWSGGFRKAVRLDQESAPVASGCRGWFGCGPVSPPAPTPNIVEVRGGRMTSAPTAALQERTKRNEVSHNVLCLAFFQESGYS